MKFNKIDNYIFSGAFLSFFITAVFLTGFTRPYWISIVLTMISSLIFSFITIIIWKKLGIKLLDKWKELHNEE